MNIGVLGAGTWGTALAALLANNGHRVTLWSAIPAEIDELATTRRHINLPDSVLPETIIYAKDIAKACSGAEMVIFVTPSQYIRATAHLAAPHLSPGVIAVSAAKGLERRTLLSMTEILQEEIKAQCPALSVAYAALSGPTHAEEVAIGLPTSIVAACSDEEVSIRIARAFASSCMRVYTNTDVLGVEVAGALKNIVAIASGMCRGMGFGDNAQAMLITRGAAEITRMGLTMGCHRRTFMGLAGIGDLIVTCTSRHSRNNRCGELIGKGKCYEDAEREIGMVVEGYHALEAAMELTRRYGIEMPITEAVYDVIKNGKRPIDAMQALMSRDLKNEIE